MPDPSDLCLLLARPRLLKTSQLSKQGHKSQHSKHELMGVHLAEHNRGALPFFLPCPQMVASELSIIEGDMASGYEMG